jgi:hypothetical protein
MHRYGPVFVVALLVFISPSLSALAQEGFPVEAGVPGMEGVPMEGAAASLDEYVAEMVKTEGLFNYYTDEETKRVLLELSPERLDQPYFLSMTLSRGTGDWLFTAPMMWADAVVEFHRDGDAIEFIEPNYQYTTVMGEPMALAVDRGLSDTIIGRAYVEAESEDDGRVVIDLASLLFGPVNEIEAWGSFFSFFGGGCAIDLEGSHVESIKGFPKNDEIDTRITVTGIVDLLTMTSTGSQILGMHFSLSAPPDPGYSPRSADDRVGHFLNVSMDYSVETDRAETRYVRYVNRWRLEKQDPEAELSEPVEPIVFWLENTIPYEYRDAVREGVLLWNDAFERAGFKNALTSATTPYDGSFLLTHPTPSAHPAPIRAPGRFSTRTWAYRRT